MHIFKKLARTLCILSISLTQIGCVGDLIKCDNDDDCSSSQQCILYNCVAKRTFTEPSTEPTPDITTTDIPTADTPPPEETKQLEEECVAGSVKKCSIAQREGICGDGVIVCVQGRWTTQCQALNEPQAEECNGLDDNCDGKVDNLNEQACYTGPRGTEGVGSCVPGIKTCVGGQWSACNNEVTPRKETCDGTDENCDGKVDPITECQCLNEEKRDCFPSSSNGCVATGDVFLCEGNCKVGTQTCKDGVWGACTGATEPSTESCNGKDDNCDGRTDEGCMCITGKTQSCGVSDVGVCKKGTQTCDSKGHWGTCVGAVSPTSEVCNGQDDNCDGKTDETYPGKGAKCVVSGKSGICIEGVITCSAGKKSCKQLRFATNELCNGKDDDCDGNIDEDFANKGKDCSLGKGLCKRNSKFVCTADGKGVTCPVTPGKPATEVCNNKDDDCDGMTDEVCGPQYAYFNRKTQSSRHLQYISPDKFKDGRKTAIFDCTNRPMFLNAIRYGNHPRISYSINCESGHYKIYTKDFIGTTHSEKNYIVMLPHKYPDESWGQIAPPSSTRAKPALLFGHNHITNLQTRNEGTIYAFKHPNCNSSSHALFATIVGKNPGHVSTNINSSGECIVRPYNNKNQPTLLPVNFWVASLKRNASIKTNTAKTIKYQNQFSDPNMKWTFTSTVNSGGFHEYSVGSTIYKQQMGALMSIRSIGIPSIEFGTNKLILHPRSKDPMGLYVILIP
ncbi:MAG: hypothetical protein CL920_28695 [Deltaproteobacteria bacterium]|nr:hypothetical protein [Deltaproteobacteria bacterium]MBU52695.1 hypothetical protein [Deltaproteobacteria bacterium]|tara:strand:+ start:3461 stop:5656 length:2196 start_codon:yes stop_codon:yes gene_type:complete